MRAFVCTTQKEGDGDDWVERHEFVTFLRNVFYFNRVFYVFSKIDSSNDRRLDLKELTKGLPFLNIKATPAEAKKIFNEIYI